MREQVCLGMDAWERRVISVHMGAGGDTFRSRLGCECLVQAEFSSRLE